jgi:hypothetical protein
MDPVVNEINALALRQIIDFIRFMEMKAAHCAKADTMHLLNGEDVILESVDRIG